MIWIIIIIVILALAVTIYFLSREVMDLKDDIEVERFRNDAYRQAAMDNKELQKKAEEIDKQIEVKKNERKKLSKTDKIKLANNRNSGD